MLLAFGTDAAGLEAPGSSVERTEQLSATAGGCGRATNGQTFGAVIIAGSRGPGLVVPLAMGCLGYLDEYP